jgi:hypothetical protein
MIPNRLPNSPSPAALMAVAAIAVVIVVAAIAVVVRRRSLGATANLTVKHLIRAFVPID